MSEFSIRATKQLIKTQTSKRVSEEACQKLRNLMEHYGMEISKEAMEYAQEDGRKTVRDSDIKKALRDRREIVAEEVKER